ncbi:hypothetical protein CSAL01_13435 [Colletotrichum salicis]|uniref:Uncharacterized protein n=1 Tax=Colletotrichum salicis TaxID=1209931 RepID=A0A135V257_9PEZI|nr:hypothetical protein CSAL01_13435 [Colletotrichum salicis]
MDRSADRWNEISPLLRFLIVIGVVETLATILYFGITLWYLARHKKPVDDESQPRICTKRIRGARGIVVTMDKVKEQAPLARVVLAPERRGGPREEAWEPIDLPSTPSITAATPWYAVPEASRSRYSLSMMALQSYDRS